LKKGLIAIVDKGPAISPPKISLLSQVWREEGGKGRKEKARGKESQWGGREEMGGGA